MDETFAAALQRRRHSSMYSLAELAAEVGYTRSHLNHVERGTKPPTFTLATRLDQCMARGTDDDSFTAIAARERPRAHPKTQSITALPPRPRHLLERDRALNALGETAHGSIAILSGPPGAGTSALAAHCAHAWRNHYDSLVWCDVRNRTSYAALEELLVLVGNKAPSHSWRERCLQWQQYTADRAVLLVLDGGESTENIRTLLPVGTDCTTLVTSRTRLSFLASETGARQHRLGPLSRAGSVQLLSDGLEGRISPHDAERVAQTCSDLPLALSFARERLDAQPDTSDVVAADLARDPWSLLSAVDNPHDTVADRLLSWHDTLPREHAQAARIIARAQRTDPEPLADAEISTLLGLSLSDGRRVAADLLAHHVITRTSAGYDLSLPLLSHCWGELVTDEEWRTVELRWRRSQQSLTSVAA